jgi:DNA modification methylase
MKPVALIERQLKNNAKAGAVVLDVFGGSGSTLIAAQRLGMAARLVEFDPRFCDVIVKRWQDYTNRHATLESTGEIFAVVGEACWVSC